ncbi:Uncharacterised protein [Mycobacteroides abscessus subsp. abscessus]|nr:Uncharacterised protein [Mycobacteroides abscessus subsp. abscessus]
MSSIVTTVACIASVSFWVRSIMSRSTTMVFPMISACCAVLPFCRLVNGSC